MPPAKKNTTPAPAAPADPLLDRLWSEPVGTGEPEPVDPKRDQPGLSPEAIREILDADS